MKKNNGKNILQAKDISKKYRNKNVLEKINFDVFKGDILLIKGKSGAGKSTLLYILGNLISPDSGKVIFNGKEVCKREMSKIRREKIGFMFQEFFLIEHASVYENIIIPFALNGKSMTDDMRQKVFKMCKEMDIEEYLLNVKVKTLSLGEKARIALIRALIFEPKICIFDEPTGNLDMDNSSRISLLIEKENKNLKQTFIIATHSDIFDDIANRILILEEGRIKWVKG